MKFATDLSDRRRMEQELRVAIDRAEDAVLAIQGALVLGRALNDPTVFTRSLARLEARLLAPAD